MRSLGNRSKEPFDHRKKRWPLKPINQSLTIDRWSSYRDCIAFGLDRVYSDFERGFGPRKYTHSGANTDIATQSLAIQQTPQPITGHVCTNRRPEPITGHVCTNRRPQPITGHVRTNRRPQPITGHVCTNRRPLVVETACIRIRLPSLHRHLSCGRVAF